MYYYISGSLVMAQGGMAVIDNNGIAYKMSISERTLGRLKASDSENVRLYTHFHVREDSQELYGFYDTEEQSIFEMLITVSGVGPRAALSILSVLSPEKFALCVISEDAKAISSAQGIGLKTAQKIILELKDKIAKESGGQAVQKSAGIKSSAAPHGDYAEALDALCVLGYTRAEAMKALSFEGSTELHLEELIRQGLKRLTKGK